MTAIGYALSSEEHGPAALVRNARAAEEAGFEFALISDHFHPWIERHPHSPFVWGVLGAIAQATDRLRVGTGVTCPTIRIHPAIIAHAAATTAALMPGRFFLGVGTGENLNEHILGRRAGRSGTSARRCWRRPSRSSGSCGTGEVTATVGATTAVAERAPVHAARRAAADPRRGERATHGRAGRPDRRRVHRDGTGRGAARRPTGSAGGDGPRFGQVTMCWATSEAEARRTAHEWWPTAALHGEVTQELPNPAQFTDLVKDRDRGPGGRRSSRAARTPRSTSSAIRDYVDAGYDHVYLHQVGPDQAGFLEFAEAELLPELTRTAAAVR